MREAASTGARLLVADDNKVNRLLLSRNLELQGHTVACAENGRIALEMLRRDRFDLLLLDMEMPEMDGFAVLAELKKDLQLRDLPVIVTSSLEGIDHVVRCIELGAEDYLPKPVNPVLLKARIGASLEKKRLRDQQKELAASPRRRSHRTCRIRGFRWAASGWMRRCCSATSEVSRRSRNRSPPRTPSSCSTLTTR
jgi:CheY-like chemotaxis protein